MAESDTTLLLIRHGQTEWNLAGRVQGQTDSPLTTLGQAQAQSLGLAFAQQAEWVPGDVLHRKPVAVYASDLGRATQTARPIAEALELTVGTRPSLREMNFGELEGLSWEEVEEKQPEAGSRLWGSRADPEFRPAGGESRIEMHTRSRNALTELCERYPGETIVVVSHGGVIGYFLRFVLGIPMDIPPPFRTLNGALSAFQFSPQGRFKLDTWGWVPPLARDAT